MTTSRRLLSLALRAATQVAAGVDAGSIVRHGGVVPPDHPARRRASRHG